MNVYTGFGKQLKYEFQASLMNFVTSVESFGATE